MDINHVPALLERAAAARTEFLTAEHNTAFRLFNGFTEGNPLLVIDIFASTAVIHDYSPKPEAEKPVFVESSAEFITSNLPWIRCIILKTRSSRSSEDKNGVIIRGENPDTEITEHGVRYAIDLMMNRDTGFYIDTRNLRKWIIDNLKGKSVLNTFAYTGSLGTAALAGGASKVIQLDLNDRFMSLTKKSYAINNLKVNSRDFAAEDFFPAISHMKHEKAMFDCVILDPPFFSKTSKGIIDLQNNCTGLINKVRPLIADGGRLISINNALFLSGQEYMDALEKLCADGYMSVESLIPVPPDFAGPQCADIQTDSPAASPAPFNHPTKIAILKVRRKQTA